MEIWNMEKRFPKNTWRFSYITLLLANYSSYTLTILPAFPKTHSDNRQFSTNREILPISRAVFPCAKRKSKIKYVSGKREVNVKDKKYTNAILGFSFTLTLKKKLAAKFMTLFRGIN